MAGKVIEKRWMPSVKHHPHFVPDASIESDPVYEHKRF
jgi:hypothetical protein